MVTVEPQAGAELRAGTRLEVTEARVVPSRPMEAPAMEDQEWVSTTSKATEGRAGEQLVVLVASGVKRGEES